MSDLIRQIDIQQVDTQDLRYKVFLSQPDLSSLIQSIKTTGLLSFPILRPVEGHFVILSGFNRIRALREAGKKSFEARIVSKGASEHDCLVKSICSAAFSKNLSQAEMALCIGRLSHFMDVQDISECSQALLNTGINLKMVRDLLSIYQLPFPALEMMHNGQISFRTCLHLTDIDKKEIPLFLQLFNQVKASTGKQIQIVTHIFDIAARDQTKIASIFADPGFQSILSATDTPENVKADQIRSYLYEKRFPLIQKTRLDFTQALSELHLKGKIKITETENFEKPDVTVTFTAKSCAEFKKRIDQLSEIAASECIERIFIL